MAPTDIDRIPPPMPDEFFEAYVYRSRPVVISGLFGGQPIDELRSMRDAVREWAPVQIAVQEEYASADKRARAAEPAVMSLKEYVALIDEDPSTALCCTEYETPARVLAAFRLPAVCAMAPDSRAEVFDLPKKYGDADLVTNIFVANAGNVAHLHFDGDHRQVLLHQVFGRKRIVLFPPTAAIHLRTLDGPYGRPSLAGVYLEDMSDQQRRDTVEAWCGYETILEPGETLYIPMLMWHHIEYLDHAMSFNLRFGRTAFGRFLSLDNFHRDPFIQNVGATMTGPTSQLDTFEPTMRRITNRYVAPAPDLRHKVADVRSLFRELCFEHAPEASPDRLCPMDREEEQVERIVQSRDMTGGMKYAPPEVLAKMRPAGAASDRQRAIVDERLRSCGYGAETTAKVLFNRFAKQDPSMLTRVEAAQLIEYLTSPGAVW